MADALDRLQATCERAEVEGRHDGSCIRLRKSVPALIEFARVALSLIGDHDPMCSAMQEYGRCCRCGQAELQAARDRLMAALEGRDAD